MFEIRLKNKYIALSDPFVYDNLRDANCLRDNSNLHWYRLFFFFPEESGFRFQSYVLVAGPCIETESKEKEK